MFPSRENGGDEIMNAMVHHLATEDIIRVGEYLGGGGELQQHVRGIYIQRTSLACQGGGGPSGWQGPVDPGPASLLWPWKLIFVGN